ncbi:uncharacterized protein LOC107368229 [Tetranychus urticae]|nr:uncharacterized protein LOC107368229 [Tetranychus urticae]
MDKCRCSCGRDLRLFLEEVNLIYLHSCFKASCDQCKSWNDACFHCGQQMDASNSMEIKYTEKPSGLKPEIIFCRCQEALMCIHHLTYIYQNRFVSSECISKCLELAKEGRALCSSCDSQKYIECITVDGKISVCVECYFNLCDNIPSFITVKEVLTYQFVKAIRPLVVDNTNQTLECGAFSFQDMDSELTNINSSPDSSYANLKRILPLTLEERCDFTFYRSNQCVIDILIDSITAENIGWEQAIDSIRLLNCTIID